MNKQKPIILNQAELDWEGWDGPSVVAVEGPLRWKILVSGERGPSSRLTTGIAEMTPSALLRAPSPRTRRDILCHQRFMGM